jgi:hypothetical protein
MINGLLPSNVSHEKLGKLILQLHVSDKRRTDIFLSGRRSGIKEFEFIAKKKVEMLRVSCLPQKYQIDIYFNTKRVPQTRSAQKNQESVTACKKQKKEEARLLDGRPK